MTSTVGYGTGVDVPAGPSVTLEVKVLQNLIAQLKAQGQSPQRVLESQIFQKLPLDKKLQVAGLLKDELVQDPVRRGVSGILRDGVVAAGLAGLGTYTAGMIAGGINAKASIPAIAITSGIGGMLGMLSSTVRDKMNYRGQQKARDLAADPMSLVAARSMPGGSYIDSPYSDSAVLTRFTTAIDSTAQKLAPVLNSQHHQIMAHVAARYAQRDAERAAAAQKGAQ